MTAAEFADLVQARRTDKGKWQARCPAHKDRLPSLSIRNEPDGRVLLHCFAGCTVGAILAVLRRTKSQIEPATVCEYRESLFEREQQLRSAAKIERDFARAARLANEALVAQRDRCRHQTTWELCLRLELRGAA